MLHKFIEENFGCNSNCGISKEIIKIVFKYLLMFIGLVILGWFFGGLIEILICSSEEIEYTSIENTNIYNSESTPNSNKSTSSPNEEAKKKRTFTFKEPNKIKRNLYNTNNSNESTNDKTSNESTDDKTSNESTDIDNKSTDDKTSNADSSDKKSTNINSTEIDITDNKSSNVDSSDKKSSDSKSSELLQNSLNVCSVLGYKISINIEPVQSLFGIIFLFVMFVFWKFFLVIRKCAISSGLIKKRSRIFSGGGAYKKENISNIVELEIIDDEEKEPDISSSFVVLDDEYDFQINIDDKKD
jgi:hypothetical protein